MKLANRIFIHRPANTVWAFIENPTNMLLWDPKVKHVSPSSFSSPQQGYRYAITYQLHENSRANEFSAEFAHYEPLSKLVIRHAGGISTRNRVIEEIYELLERDSGALLTQTSNVENSGVNIFLRFLIWIIRRWGKPTGKPYLAELRDIIEHETSDP